MMLARVLVLLWCCSGVALASPASELVRQFVGFVEQYHVDADNLDLKALQSRTEAMLTTRCGTDSACPSSKIYADLKSITQSLDTSSQFVAQPELEQLRLEQLGDANLDTRFALGIEVRENIVYRVLPGSSAFENGVKRGDKVLGIRRNGQVWTQNTFPDATPVMLRLERAGQAFDLDLSPASGLLLGLQNPEGRMLDAQTAYLRIPSFKAVGTAQKVHNLLSNLTTRGAQKLVLDLRFNTGGYLDETLLSLSAFFQGEVLKLRSKIGILTYVLKNGMLEAIGSDTKVSLEFPFLFPGSVTVLVNAQTASAAEVMALAWQRGSYTKFVGEPSAGRSKYATLPIGMVDGSQLRLAVIRHLYPSEQPLLEKLTPDLAVKDDVQALNKGVDPVLEAALK
jgi:carboxyl-terminal processing protease